MATTYKSVQSAPTNTSNTDLYTVPAGKSTVVSVLHIANVTASAATATVYLRIGGATAADSNALCKSMTIPANGIFSAVEGLCLAATDVITVATSVSNALTFTMSLGEQ